MQKKPAAMDRGEMADNRMPPDGTGPINILVAGIPTHSLLTMIKTRYPGELNLYVAESRPYEMLVARAIAAIPMAGISVSIVTDNMLAALIKTVPIHAVWSQYMRIEGGRAAAINGAHMAALLANAFGIPCMLHLIDDLPDGETGRFAGEDVAVSGAECMAWAHDVVPLEWISEIVANG